MTLESGATSGRIGAADATSGTHNAAADEVIGNGGSEDVEDVLGGQVGGWLVVPEDFEDDGLVLDVVDKGFGDCDGDVLRVAEDR